MAGRINSDIKQQFKNAGLWSQFLWKRDELKFRGFSPKEARCQALEEFLPKCEEKLKSRPLPDFWTCLVNDLSGSPETVKWLLDCLAGQYSPSPNLGAKNLFQYCRNNVEFRRKFLDMALEKLGEDSSELAEKIKKANLIRSQ
jgi:hypothetical protein